MSDGSLYGWGDNRCSQIGCNNTPPIEKDSAYEKENVNGHHKYFYTPRHIRFDAVDTETNAR